MVMESERKNRFSGLAGVAAVIEVRMAADDVGRGGECASWRVAGGGECASWRVAGGGECAIWRVAGGGECASWRVAGGGECASWRVVGGGGSCCSCSSSRVVKDGC